MTHEAYIVDAVRTPVGRKKGPVDRWGNKALGERTRHNKRTDKYIVRRRASKG